MSANTGTLAGRRPFQVPTWIVVSVAVLTAGALAVVAASQESSVREPSTAVVQEGTAPVQSESAEMAAQKAAIGLRATGRTSSTVTGPSEAAELAGQKAAIGLRFTDAISGPEIGSVPSEATELAALKAALADQRRGSG